MKTLTATTKLMAMVLIMPLIQACGKARYQQLDGRGPESPTFLQQTPPTAGQVRPVQQPLPPPPQHVPTTGSSNNNSIPGYVPPPVTETPDRDRSGEQGRELPPPVEASRINVTIESNQPAAVRGTGVPASEWMDPTRYPRAQGSKAPAPAPAPAPQPVPRPQPAPAPRPQPAPVPVPKPQPTQVKCEQESFQQQGQALTNKMDILFVVDTSESVLREREAAAANIDKLIEQLPEGVDYNVAVMLAHSSGTGRDGELFVSPQREAAVLKSKDISRDQIRTSLHAKLTQFPGDRNSDGGELGLYSLMKALEDVNRNGGDKGTRALNLGMFRADAAQTIIFLADENDLCTRQTPNGASVVADPNRDEIPAAKKYCRGITAQSVHNMLMTRRGPGMNVYQGNTKQTVVLPVLVAAMVYTNPATVPTRTSERWAAENEVGYGYLEMVRLNGGVAIDLANIDMTSALQRIGQAAYGKLVKEVSHQVPEGTIDFSTVCTLIDGKEVPYVWNQIEKRLTARGLARPGSKVEFSYCFDSGDRSANRYSTIQIDPRCTVLRQRFNR